MKKESECPAGVHQIAEDGAGLKVIRNKSDREMSVDLASELVRQTNQSKIALVELEQKYKEAGEFLDKATDRVKSSWLNWLDESKTYLNEIRMWRMAMEREANSGGRAGRDLLEFLGSAETADRLKTLKELVEVAERLKALKESGFLDSMVDTMLRVKP